MFCNLLYLLHLLDMALQVLALSLRLFPSLSLRLLIIRSNHQRTRVQMNTPPSLLKIFRVVDKTERGPLCRVRYRGFQSYMDVWINLFHWILVFHQDPRSIILPWWTQRAKGHLFLLLNLHMMWEDQRQTWSFQHRFWRLYRYRSDPPQWFQLQQGLDACQSIDR